MWQKCRKHKSTMSGSAAEKLAEQFLRKQGLIILEKNYATRRGEIDLITKQGDVIAFVEVRYRRQDRYGTPAETITYHKQKRLMAAASYYLQERKLTESTSCRFDVVSISSNLDAVSNESQDNKNHYRVEWLVNAFGY
jgi:putative endonuclease